MKRYFLAALLCIAAPYFITVQAGEPKTPPPNKPPKVAPKDTDPAEAPDPESAARYTFPKDADSDALVDFCLQLQDYEPEDDADADLHDAKAPRAIKRACKRILELEKDKESDNARFARRMTLADQLDTASDINTTRSGQLLKRTREFLKSPKVNSEDADVAAALADFLSTQTSPKAIEWSQKIGADLAKHPVPEVAAISDVLLGTAKRLGLIGKPLQLKGTTLQDKPFDLADLKDKVVLIDFWATWCPHCVDEIPLMKKCYEAYRSKGFEIVGISADEERQTLEDFLKIDKLPWTTLHHSGGKHPSLDEFAINAFPSNFLIGKDGKVIAMNVRDIALADELKKLLGAPEPGKEIKDEDAPPQKGASRDPKGKRKKGEPDPSDEEDNSPEALKKKYSF